MPKSISKTGKNKETNSTEILPDNADENAKRSALPSILKWGDMTDAFAQRTILTYVRKWVDSIAHYGDFVMRKMQNNGIYCEYTYNTNPTIDGYNVYLSIRIVGIDPEKVGYRFSSIRRMIEKSRKYKSFIEEILNYGEDNVGTDNYSSTAEVETEAGRESESEEYNIVGPDTDSTNEGS